MKWNRQVYYTLYKYIAPWQMYILFSKMLLSFNISTMQVVFKIHTYII